LGALSIRAIERIVSTAGVDGAKCAMLVPSEFADWSTSYLVRIND